MSRRLGVVPRCVLYFINLIFVRHVCKKDKLSTFTQCKMIVILDYHLFCTKQQGK